MKQLLITIAAVVLVGCGEPSSELLLQSVIDGNVEAVKQHLADGADVNAKMNNGMPPLDCSALIPPSSKKPRSSTYLANTEARRAAYSVKLSRSQR